MKEEKKEYTLGQTIRFEATSLYHHALQLQKLAPEPKELFGETTERLRASILTEPDGRFRGINRQEQHYRELMELLEQARDRLEKSPAPDGPNEGWLLVNQCHHSCAAILDVMQNRARSTGVPRR